MTSLYNTAIDVTTHGLADSASPGRSFGYDATVDSGRRRAASGATKSEDRELFPSARHKLVGGAREIARNFAIAKWAIGKHVDFVTKFRFFSRTGIKTLDDRIEAIVAEDAKRERNHVAGRHRLSRFMRIQEFRKTSDGDVGILRVKGGKLQIIEGDRIRDPHGDFRGIPVPFPLEPTIRWVNGVLIDDELGGKALAYAIHNRGVDGASFRYDRTIAAQHLFLNGYYEREDQIRGISPIASAINSFRDVYEGIDYALAKAKVSQLFAMVFYREAGDSLNETTKAEDDNNGDGTAEGYTVNFGKGPQFFDLDPGDRAEFLESQQPSTQFQDFMRVVIMIALKSLDIPYSFFDEKHTNFFGSRGAWLHYEESAEHKRDDNIELLDWITRWRLKLAVLDGRLELPRGWSVKDLQWEHVPKGMPWWDPQKEITGDLMAIGAALDTPQRIIKRTGTGDWKDNIDSIAEYLEYARSKNVPILFQAGSSVIQADKVDAETDEEGADRAVESAN